MICAVRQLAFQLLDAALDEALLLARGVVLGVFLQVAVRAGFGDRGDHLRALDRLQFVEFRAQAQRAFRWSGGRCCSSLQFLVQFLQRPHPRPVPRKSSECTSARAPAMVVEYVTRCCSASRRIENESAIACLALGGVDDVDDLAVLDQVDDVRTAFDHLVDALAGDALRAQVARGAAGRDQREAALDSSLAPPAARAACRDRAPR